MENTLEFFRPGGVDVSVAGRKLVLPAVSGPPGFAPLMLYDEEPLGLSPETTSAPGDGCILTAPNHCAAIRPK